MIKKALTIAGFDASGGAGIQADLKTFSAFGVYGMSILTALPIQNTCGVTNCYEIPLKAIEEQLESIFSDIIPDVIKIGMLFNSDIVNLVANYLNINAHNIPIVIDPVMVAKSGDSLLKPEAVKSLKENLFPLATIVTPNIDETNMICNTQINTETDIINSANYILSLGPKAVLIKGGHLIGNECKDLLVTNKFKHWIASPRINTKNTHGTGCTISAAIAANLALGLEINDSFINAKNYITGAIDGFKDETIGYGNGPVNHFFNMWFEK